MCLQLNVSYPATGAQKLIEIEDERKLRVFYEKRMGAEVEADTIGDEWKGYVVRIAGGNDKQGFPMKQGILTNGELRLLLCGCVRASVCTFSLKMYSSCQAVSVFCSPRATRATVKGALVRGGASLFADALLMLTCQSLPWLSLRRVNR